MTDTGEEQPKQENNDETPSQEGSEDPTQSSEKECPECGHPVENLRATCSNCGYEYSKDDYDDPEAGNEYLAGSNVTDEGEEITDEGPGAEEGTE